LGQTARLSSVLSQTWLHNTASALPGQFHPNVDLSLFPVAERQRLDMPRSGIVYADWFAII